MTMIKLRRHKPEIEIGKAPDLREAFKDPAIPDKQRALADSQLSAMYAGHPPRVFSVCTNALKLLPGDEPLSLLEVGCASGYYSEIIHHMVPRPFRYTGADFSEAMIELARSRYPNSSFTTADARELPFPSQSYDVVLAGAILEHVGEWSRVLDELCRVSNRYLILHRTVVSLKRPTYTDVMHGYDVLLYRTYINEGELLDRLSSYGFRQMSRETVERAPSGTAVLTYALQLT